jgi:hypothetical protein
MTSPTLNPILCKLHSIPKRYSSVNFCSMSMELTNLLWDGFEELLMVSWYHSTIQFKDVPGSTK